MEVEDIGVHLPVVVLKPCAKILYLHLLPGDVMPAHVHIAGGQGVAPTASPATKVDFFLDVFFLLKEKSERELSSSDFSVQKYTRPLTAPNLFISPEITPYLVRCTRTMYHVHST